MNNIWLALLMSVLAGLATGLGGFAVLFDKGAGKTFLSAALGFSAGVMFYVSMVEIFASAQEKITAANAAYGGWITAGAFFGGMLLIALIEKFIPSPEVGDDGKLPAMPGEEKTQRDNKLLRTGVFTALAIAIHNFPEGLATFVSALDAPSVAVPIVVAVAIHNIPEGIAVAVPMFRATGSKGRAFLYALLSGLAEPVGALIGMLLLMPIMNDLVFGTVFAVVAGIMIFIVIDELLPSSREGSPIAATVGVVAGMAVMAVSLLLF